jgi:hypothetical protein
MKKKKHVAFRNIKPFFNCENADNCIEQFNKCENLCKLIKKKKRVSFFLLDIRLIIKNW